MRGQLFVLTAVLSLSVGFTTDVFSLGSAESDTVKVSIPDNLLGQPGDTVDVPVILWNTGPLRCFDSYFFTLFFRPEVLEYDTFEYKGTCGEPLGPPDAQGTANGKITVGALSLTDSVCTPALPCTLIVLKFRVIGNPRDTTNLCFGTFELSRNGFVPPLIIARCGKLRVGPPDSSERLIVDSRIATPGSVNQKLQIRLENKLAICGIQFTAKFDRAVLKVNDIGATIRTRGWEVSRKIFTDSLNAVLFHIPNDSLTAGREAILEMDFDVRGNARLGDTTHVRLANAMASDCNGKQIPLETQDGFIVFGLKGDLNADGKIDQADLDLLVAIIVDPSLQTPFTQWAGDLDDNGVLDIRDVILLNNIVNPGSSDQTLAQALSKASASLLLHWGEWQALTNGSVLPLLTTITGGVKGFQFTLRGEQAKWLGPAVLASNHPNLRIASGRHGDEMIVLVYGSGDAVLPIGEVELLHFISAGTERSFPEISNQLAVTGMGQFFTTTVQNTESNAPVVFRLLPNYPNPTREATTFQFELAKAGDVQIEIFDLMGRRVVSLSQRNLKPGLQQVRWDGRDSKGRRVPAGVYYFEIRSGAAKATGSFSILP
jgi:hypothetical protein